MTVIEHELPGTTEIEVPVLSPEGEILLRAADLIEECGWVQNRLGDREMGFCALGALYEVDESIPYRACGLLMKKIGGICIANWNNAPGRTKAEVVRTMREAAK